jgi:hypothetical protein
MRCDITAIERITQSVRKLFPDLAEISTKEILARIGRAFIGGLYGSLDHVVEKINVYPSAGVEELIIQWGVLDDFDGLQIIAEEVLPYFKVEAS